jgi:hypothetical protein
MPGRVILAVLLIASQPVHPVDAQAVPTERRQGVPADRADRAQGVPEDRVPWFGTWHLVLAPAGRFESPVYKRVTTRIEPWDQGVRVTYDLVKTRGGVEHREWTGRFDGKDYPVQGLDYVLTNAYRVIDDRSYGITIKRDARVVATAVAVVAADGRTLTVTTTEQDAEGRPVTSTAVYRSRPD